MKRFLVSSAFLFSSACLPKPPVASFENDSAYPDVYFERVWAACESLSESEIKLDKFHVHVFESEAEFRNACLDVDGLGCTDGKSKIAILGAVGTNFPEVGAATAHQLGHVHYMQDEGDIDGDHSHEEWFGPAGYEMQIKLYLLNEELKNATQD